ncbi:MAG: cytochrome c family protein [Caulobacteraceae bacterium]|nr:MAG: cytochrome c family protein [Caulobacteraceae bacterium]
MRSTVIVSGVAILAGLLAACGPGGSDSTAGSATPAAAPAAPALTDAEKQELLASLPAPYNTGNLENGKTTFALCRSCHTITPGGPNSTGPNLHGVFGRTAGTHAGFKYSDAVKNAGFNWDAEKLDAWLADPKGFLPGNRMTFVGLKDAEKRRDLIAYLKVETGYKPGE